MKIQTIGRKQARRLPLLLATALALLLSGITALVAALSEAPDAPEGDPLLGQWEEWRLLRGAPQGTLPAVTADRSRLLAGTLVLADPQHPLPPDYPAPSVRDVSAMVGSYVPAEENTLLRPEVTYGLCAMQFEHSLAGFLTFGRGAVSPAQQEEARKEAFDRYARVYPLAEALRQSQAAVPAGRESEHQTGWAVDVHLTPPLSMAKKNPLERNAGGQWLADNMWRFGFIQRYAFGDGSRGACENIHVRYVGIPHAAAMHVTGLGLEDYLSLLRREGALTLERQGVPYAYLYCVPCQGDWAFAPPCEGSVLFSADNTGWAVAAVAAQGGF